MSDDNFLSRWSRRKADAKTGRPAGDAPPGAGPATTGPAPVLPREPGSVAAPVPAAERASSEAHPEPGTGTASSGAATLEPDASLPPTAPAAAPGPPAPTLADVAALAPGDEISRFVARGVDESVKRAAVKKLFSDPRYNVMDGLDVYIDDYSQPDPIPMAMLRKMNQSKFLGLFAKEEAAEALEAERLAALESQAAVPATAGDPATQAEAADGLSEDPASPPASTQAADPATPAAALLNDAHEDPDLQLQPDDAARRPGAEIGAGRERG